MPSSRRRRDPLAPLWLWAPFLLLMPGCAGSTAALLTMGIGTALGAWMLNRGSRARALYEAETLRHAIRHGEQRQIEDGLRKQLSLAAAGEGISLERQWLARAQLGGLMVAEWRLDEAREIYGVDADRLPPLLQALAAFGRHELELLNDNPEPGHLQRIRDDKKACLEHVPARYRSMMGEAWSALEGLCLVRLGRSREAIPLLERGLEALVYNPARVIYLFHLGQAYEQVGERQLAGKTYEQATEAFPGTRLASEAKSRRLALGAGSDGLFRGMLPEAPAGEAGSDDEDEPPV